MFPITFIEVSPYKADQIYLVSGKVNTPKFATYQQN